MSEFSRRGFIGALAAILVPTTAIAMPAVIRTPGLLMPIKSLLPDTSWLHPEIIGGWFQWSDQPTYLNRKQIIEFDRKRRMQIVMPQWGEGLFPVAPIPPLVFWPDWREPA